MKSRYSCIACCLVTLIATGCGKKDESKPSGSTTPTAAEKEAATPKAPATTATPTTTGPTVENIENGVAKLIDRMAAVAEKYKGKCDEQGAAITAEGEKMDAEIKKLAADADVLRKANKLSYATYGKIVEGKGRKPTRRYEAAIEGCKMNALGLVAITIPIFKKDVPPPPPPQ